MASSTISANPQPLATTSNSRQNHLNRARSFSSAAGAFDDLDPRDSRPNPAMSFSMSQGSQGSNLMMQPGGAFRQYEGSNALHRRNSSPQIYTVSPFLVQYDSLLTLAGHILGSRCVRDGGQWHRGDAPAQRQLVECYPNIEGRWD
jgi:hypothetical protein